MQLTLSPLNSTHVFSDTLVMLNLGYFQLKARPGVWDVRLAQGRASALYDIIDASGDRDGELVYWRSRNADTGSRAVVTSKRVVVRDFTGPIVQLRVAKKAGLEHVDLLDKGPVVNEAGSEESKVTHCCVSVTACGIRV